LSLLQCSTEGHIGMIIPDGYYKGTLDRDTCLQLLQAISGAETRLSFSCEQGVQNSWQLKSNHSAKVHYAMANEFVQAQRHIASVNKITGHRLFALALETQVQVPWQMCLLDRCLCRRENIRFSQRLQDFERKTRLLPGYHRTAIVSRIDLQLDRYQRIGLTR
jgi:hypothetical protein